MPAPGSNPTPSRSDCHCWSIDYRVDWYTNALDASMERPVDSCSPERLGPVVISPDIQVLFECQLSEESRRLTVNAGLTVQRQMTSPAGS